ncbi:flagellar export chaperone FliS [Alkalihalobacillus sp. MEB130]|uniref:flagellar export chaperone FliS n=1 Tax=Alkalihalobacillus sp. MEB130 TaxID=2976704 RepID=UPI0028DF6515|nr:flagellar export chaperone FliS [Alkalihalobacillus sp. MEB130]MDT8858773.1 flagellar export chaperone FliS [Alkalihalobacillus sp. MEB130]
MAIGTPQQAYQQNKAMTSSPGELTLMLYNGCLKFVGLAKKAIAENDTQVRHQNLIKAQNIIRELMVTLKTDTPMGKNMLALYDYILNRLTEANTENNLIKLNEAEELIKDFRDTWKEALLLDRQKRHKVNS